MSELRRTFDEVPELYDRTRPHYPPGVVAGLGLSPRARIVEIGSGTGQLTGDLLAFGAAVTAVELGSALAALLARHHGGPGLRVVRSSFEAWAPDAWGFDAVVCATAWHWLDPTVRTAKAATLLRPGGVLATVTTRHVAGGTQGFFVESQRCYRRWDPSAPPGFALPVMADVPPTIDEVDTSAAFGPSRHLRFTQEISYSAEEYVDLLATYSNLRALGPGRLDGLRTCLRGLMDDDYRGRVTLRYLHELRLARRTQETA